MLINSGTSYPYKTHKMFLNSKGQISAAGFKIILLIIWNPKIFSDEGKNLRKIPRALKDFLMYKMQKKSVNSRGKFLVIL